MDHGIRISLVKKPPELIRYGVIAALLARAQPQWVPITPLTRDEEGAG
jgi:hypothetical protein